MPACLFTHHSFLITITHSLSLSLSLCLSLSLSLCVHGDLPSVGFHAGFGLPASHDSVHAQREFLFDMDSCICSFKKVSLSPYLTYPVPYQECWGVVGVGLLAAFCWRCCWFDSCRILVILRRSCSLSLCLFLPEVFVRKKVRPCFLPALSRTSPSLKCS